MAGVKLSRFVTDKTKETEGVWVDVGGGLRLKLARMGNANYTTALLGSKYFGRSSKIIGIDAKGAVDDMRNAVAEYIILGWEGLVDDDNQPIPYSVEKAREILRDTPEFYRMVLEYAEDIELYRKTAKEEVLGNSPQS